MGFSREVPHDGSSFLSESVVGRIRPNHSFSSPLLGVLFLLEGSSLLIMAHCSFREESFLIVSSEVCGWARCFRLFLLTGLSLLMTAHRSFVHGRPWADSLSFLSKSEFGRIVPDRSLWKTDLGVLFLMMEGGDCGWAYRSLRSVQFGALFLMRASILLMTVSRDCHWAHCSLPLLRLGALFLMRERHCCSSAYRSSSRFLKDSIGHVVPYRSSASSGYHGRFLMMPDCPFPSLWLGSSFPVVLSHRLRWARCSLSSLQPRKTSRGCPRDSSSFLGKD